MGLCLSKQYKSNKKKTKNLKKETHKCISETRAEKMNNKIPLKNNKKYTENNPNKLQRKMHIKIEDNPILKKDILNIEDTIINKNINKYTKKINPNIYASFLINTNNYENKDYKKANSNISKQCLNYIINNETTHKKLNSTLKINQNKIENRPKISGQNIITNSFRTSTILLKYEKKNSIKGNKGFFNGEFQKKNPYLIRQLSKNKKIYKICPEIELNNTQKDSNIIIVPNNLNSSDKINICQKIDNKDQKNIHHPIKRKSSVLTKDMSKDNSSNYKKNSTIRLQNKRNNILLNKKTISNNNSRHSSDGKNLINKERMTTECSSLQKYNQSLVNYLKENLTNDSCSSNIGRSQSRGSRRSKFSNKSKKANDIALQNYKINDNFEVKPFCNNLKETYNNEYNNYYLNFKYDDYS